MNYFETFSLSPPTFFIYPNEKTYLRYIGVQSAGQCVSSAMGAPEKACSEALSGEATRGKEEYVYLLRRGKLAPKR